MKQDGRLLSHITKAAPAPRGSRRGFINYSGELLRRGAAPDLDVARFDRLHREVAELVPQAELRVAHGVRVVVEEEGPADPVAIPARLAVVLHGEVDGVNQVRVVRPARGAAEDGDVADDRRQSDDDGQGE